MERSTPGLGTKPRAMRFKHNRIAFQLAMMFGSEEPLSDAVQKTELGFIFTHLESGLESEIGS